MLSNFDLMDMVNKKVLETVNKFNEDFEKKLDPNEIRVEFTKKGKVAGTASCRRNMNFSSIIDAHLAGEELESIASGFKINFNIVLLRENVDHFIKQTVVHELCHIFDYHLFEVASSHGYQWQLIMEHFGLSADRTHNYSTKSVVKNGAVYMCNCQEYTLSTIRHNRARKGMKYHCKKCKGILEFVEMA